MKRKAWKEASDAVGQEPGWDRIAQRTYTGAGIVATGLVLVFCVGMIVMAVIA
jgi:hypothetical protein